MNSHDQERGRVVVAGEGSVIDHAMVLLVEKFGYTARIAPPQDIGALQASAVIFRDEVSLARIVRELSSCDNSGRRPVLIGVDAEIGQPQSGFRNHPSGRKVLWINGSGPDALGQLERVLHDTLGVPDGVNSPVHMSHRELEVLRTYLLGATSKATAQKHFIGESTVKTHYQRVTRRYNEAGRPVANKAQLLRQLLADGWIDPDDAAGVA